MSNKKPYKYPFFIECCKFETDVYWKQIFTECARGKFPAAISINDNNHVYKIYLKEKNGINHILPINDIYKLWTLIKEIFTNTLNICSDSELTKRKHEVRELNNNMIHKYDNWKISNNDKRRLFDMYANELAFRYKLNTNECCNLFTFLYDTYTNKKDVLSNKNIILNGKMIINITNLVYDIKNNKLTFYLLKN
jgi:hypothetical protein